MASQAGGRRLALDTQITLAAAFDHGVTHVDRDLLALPTAQFPEMRGREPAAAMLVWRRAATRNDDGSCGSSPLSVTASSAAGSPPADAQRSARISRGVRMGSPGMRNIITAVIIRESGFHRHCERQRVGAKRRPMTGSATKQSILFAGYGFASLRSP